MTTDKLQHSKELVERIGVAMEKAGFPPAVGRVLGYLVTADPPQKTFEEIQQFLGISKSAVSTALNLLMMREIVDYITLPGDRRRYFRFAGNGLISHMKRRMGLNTTLPELLKEVLDYRANKHDEFSRNLRETLEFVSFMQKELAAAIEKWDKQKKN